MHLQNAQKTTQVQEKYNDSQTTTVVVDSTYDPTHKIDFTARVIDNSEVMTVGLSKIQQYLVKMIDKVIGAYQQPIKVTFFFHVFVFYIYVSYIYDFELYTKKLDCNTGW